MAQNTSPSHSAAIVLKSVQMFVHHLKALKLHKMVQIPDYCYMMRQVNDAYPLSCPH